jgi:hypothetical protein
VTVSSQNTPAVVINFTSASPGAGHAQSALSFQPSGAVDPHLIAYEQPERWAAYLNECYPRDHQVMRLFGVSSTTVRKWRAAEMGCRATHLQVALLTDGQRAYDRLVASEWRAAA